MHKQRLVFIQLLQSISLVIIAIWWIFFLAWQPGNIGLVQSLSYKLSPISLSPEAVSQATARALEHVSKKTPLQADVFFTRNEVSHLHDVSVVYAATRLILGFLALFSWTILIFSLWKKINLGRNVFLSARNIMVFVLLLSISSLLLFPAFFDFFHRVLFPQGNWEFPESSVLIQIFPFDFWKGMMIWLVGSEGAFTLFFHVCALSINRNENK